ncbi:hypothetical protein [Lutibaculum baratangense]|nr:hypothetical protein [Lutibaculum baratangense]
MKVRIREKRALAAIGCLVATGVVGGCAVPQRFSMVDDAKTMLLGLSEQDVTLCAGFPDQKQANEGSEIWSYRFKTTGNNLAVSTPVLYGIANTSMNYSSGGTCSVQFLFVDGRVSRIAYAGNNDTASGRDTLCEPVIDDCVRYVADYPRGNRVAALTASATASPNAPPQPPPAAEAGGKRPSRANASPHP